MTLIMPEKETTAVILTKVQLVSSVVGLAVVLLSGTAAALNVIAKEIASHVAKEAIENHEELPAHYGAPSKEDFKEAEADIRQIEMTQNSIRAAQSGFTSDISSIKSQLHRIENKVDDVLLRGRG